MSRITRERIEPGDALTSSDLNTRYGDYTQTDLNVDNAANPSFDQTQMPAEAVLINAAQGQIGVNNDLAHAAPGLVAVATSAPATRTAIAGTLGVGGGSGWTISSGTLLRVYFNLQSKSELPISPTPDPHDGTKMGTFAFREFSTTSQTLVNIGAHCWLLQLQWNLTSNSLNAGDFVDIPNQGDFQSNWSSTGKRGEPVNNLAGTVAMPAMWAGSLGWVTVAGTTQLAASERANRGNGWRNIAGSWVYSGAGQTVYGFRVLVHGVYHPYNDGTNNGLVLETAFPANSIKFRYSLGNILAMHMRAD